MIQTILSSATYQATILADLQQTGIANTTTGGKARAFCDIVGDQLGILDANKANDLAQALLPYAAGSNLDFLCQIYGVTRLPATGDATLNPGDSVQSVSVQSQSSGSASVSNQGSLPTGKQIRLARLDHRSSGGTPAETA